MSNTLLDYRPELAVDVPVPARKRSKVIVVAAGIVVAGLVAFGGVQTVALGGVNSDLAASRADVTGLRADVRSLDADLGNAQASVESLTSEVQAKDVQLASCSQAVSLSVDMDGVMHDLVTNALTFGSMAEWNRLNDRYSGLGERWATAADACFPGGGYSFS